MISVAVVAFVGDADRFHHRSMNSISMSRMVSFSSSDSQEQSVSSLEPWNSLKSTFHHCHIVVGVD